MRHRASVIAHLGEVFNDLEDVENAIDTVPQLLRSDAWRLNRLVITAEASLGHCIQHVSALYEAYAKLRHPPRKRGKKSKDNVYILRPRKR